jgi:tRNA modification GTPase
MSSSLKTGNSQMNGKGISHPFGMDDTIAAISTPPGKGGIAVIRISGIHSIEVMQKIVKIPNVQDVKSHMAHHGWIYDGNEVVDEAITTVYEKPNSYTGEDVVEISCHGGNYVSKRILNLILEQGVRAADPGEFTKRAFMNGKIDLAQAEAVSTLIEAKSEAARKIAVSQLEGKLSQKILHVREELIKACSLLEMDLDFSDEGYSGLSKDEIRLLLDQAVISVEELMGTFKTGRMCTEGIRLTIAGRPNVGKSSLMNELVQKERAIVTEIPGTTRDTLEEWIDIEGLPFKIIDTAGMRETDNPIEMKGIERAKKAMENADIILLLMDSSEPVTEMDYRLLDFVKSLDAYHMVLFSKCDLPSKADNFDQMQLRPQTPVLNISVKDGTGIQKLISALKKAAMQDEVHTGEEVILVQARQYDCLYRTQQNLLHAIQSFENEMSNEFVCLDIRGAIDSIGEIVGKTTTDDILNQIFTRFCVGK